MSLRKLKLRLPKKRRKAVAKGEIEDSVMEGWSHETYKEAYAKLPEGLEVPRPVDVQQRHLDPHLPDDITKLTSRQLGTLHGRLVSMGEWMEWEVAVAEIFATNQATYLDRLKAEVRLRQEGGTVKDKDAKTLIDGRVLEEEMKHLQLQARTKLLKAKLRGYDKCAAAISREQTRRTPEGA